MAIMRSEVKTGSSGGDWLGIKKGTIASFKDQSADFDWADVYLAIEFKVEGSDYTRLLKIAGSFDREPDGRIKDCTLLKRITYFLDAIGEMGGVNTEGNWEQESGEPITDICSHLSKYIGTTLTIYVFKELAKNGQAYTRVHNKVLPYSSTSEEELQGYINFLKSKGFIKEADPNHVNPQQPVQQNGTGNVPDLGGLDIANL